MEQIVKILQESNIIPSDYADTAGLSAKITDAVNAYTAPLITESKNKGIESGRGQITTAVSDAIVVQYKSINPSATEEQLALFKQGKVTDAMVLLLNEVQKSKQPEIEAVEKRVKQNLEQVYSTQIQELNAKVTGYETEKAETAFKNRVQGLVNGIANLDKRNGVILSDVISSLSNELSKYTPQETNGSVYLADKNGHLLMVNASAVTEKQFVANFFEDRGLVQKSQPGTNHHLNPNNPQPTTVGLQDLAIK